MKRGIGLILAVGVFVLMSSGCAQHLGNFTALSSASFNGKNLDKEHLVARDVKGGATQHRLLGIIPLNGAPKIDQAVAEALAENHGDFMKNARLYHTWSYWILYGHTSYKVQGDVYSSQE